MRNQLFAVSLVFGCVSTNPETSSLRDRFPKQAGVVLENPVGLRATEHGFAPALDVGDANLTLSLPDQAEDPVRFRLGGGFEITMRELGAAGPGSIEDHAVAYPRTGGTSFWSVAEHGYEEWLLLGADAVRHGLPVATWEIEGGALRQVDEAIEIVDDTGAVRLNITAPMAYRADGEQVAARMQANGSRAELLADAEGEDLLIDPLIFLPGGGTSSSSSSCCLDLHSLKLTPLGCQPLDPLHLVACGH